MPTSNHKFTAAVGGSTITYLASLLYLFSYYCILLYMCPHTTVHLLIGLRTTRQVCTEEEEAWGLVVWVEIRRILLEGQEGGEEEEGPEARAFLSGSACHESHAVAPAAVAARGVDSPRQLHSCK